MRGGVGRYSWRYTSDVQQQRKTAKSTGVVSFLFGTSLLTYNIKDSAVSLFDNYYSGVWDYNTQVYKAQRATCDDAKQSSASDAIC